MVWLNVCVLLLVTAAVLVLLAGPSQHQQVVVCFSPFIFIPLTVIVGLFGNRDWVFWLIAFGTGALILIRLLAPPFSLPKPVGPYAIGTTTRQFINRELRDALAPSGSDRWSEATVQFWYPISQETRGVCTPYLAHGMRVAEGAARLLRNERGQQFPIQFLSYSGIWFCRAHAIVDAEALTGTDPWPVVVVLTGFGGHRNMHTVQIEALAAQGYVVIGIDLPFICAHVQSAQDGSDCFVRPRAEVMDPIGTNAMISLVANQSNWVIARALALPTSDDAGVLASLNLGKVGIYGVSLGAITAGLIAQTNPQISAVAMADAEMHEAVADAGIGKPALWFTRTPDEMRTERNQSGGWSDEDIHATTSTVEQAMAHQPEGLSTEVHIPGIFHAQFTDVPLWFGALLRSHLEGPTPTRQAHQSINAHLLAFFSQWLSTRESS
ncbi:alpha/beta fold hydrolase [Stomatohabitans albus]|uniref:alpha/beta fold hydrolase n=1 Tax=Stomatohabitans albus TaxID=3110766 RepID=UPI00300CAA5E